MQTGLRPDEIQRRIREAKSWQEHSRLIFEVLHSPDKKDFQHLVEAYRSELKKAPTPLLRWALVAIILEINEIMAINSPIRYGIDPQMFLQKMDDTWVFVELRQVTEKSPRDVFGYMGLAAAYSLGLYDLDIARYEKVVDQQVLKWKETNGRKIPLETYRIIENPERWRRYRQYRDKVYKMDPQNPYVSYWEADGLSSRMDGSTRDWGGDNLLFYKNEQLRKMSKENRAAEGLKHATAAYENGFKDFSPVCGLAYIIYFAWHAKQHNEMRKWGDELKPWIRQNPKSPYVEFLRLKFSHNCPYLGELAQNK